jgi:Protein of unknown function (DUF2950)
MGGFSLVAWPAEYGVTEIHPFIVTVFEKDIQRAGGKAPAAPLRDSTLTAPGHEWNKRGYQRRTVPTSTCTKFESR